MPFAITNSCCTDAACVRVCPVGCIHPAPGEPGFGTSEILHIDPAACIDCGACADACPVGAIFPVDRLGAHDAIYADINAGYYSGSSGSTGSDEAGPDPSGAAASQRRHVADDLDVAVVGTGPAGMYTVNELLAHTEARITLIDEHLTPGGLVRSGVAPDHPHTKQIERAFALALRHPRVEFVGGVRLGRDVALAELGEQFAAVFLATGADAARRLGIDGEDAPRVTSALDVVRWSGGVPGFDTSPLPEANLGRAVVVGTGNVALDLARLLTLSPDELGRTDVADRTLDWLRVHRLDDVVLLGRGDAAHAAYTEAEFRALDRVPGLTVHLVDADEPTPSFEPHTGARITVVFGSRIEQFVDHGGHVGVRVERVAGPAQLDADVVITSLGYDVDAEGATTLGLPHDPATGAYRHEGGRVVTTGAVRDGAGIYVTGWAKRGARGGIGANRLCAAETVQTFVDDVAGGVIVSPKRTRDTLRDALRLKGISTTDARGARAIDRAERSRGEAADRPRVKFVTTDELARTAARTRRLSVRGRSARG